MTIVFVILAVVFAIGLAVGIYAWLAPRAAEPAAPVRPAQPLHVSTDWTTQAGAEFAGLAESARCDLIFAVSDLQDERSQQLLLHALNDPSDAVALAAAHALARRGSAEAVSEYAQQHPGERAQHIVQTLALLE
jgi:HEAT repeat protein